MPIWTAVQSNKEGASSDVVGLENMAESYGQAHICDFVVGLSRKPTEKSTGYGTLFIAKNRNGIDGIVMKIHLDTSKSKMRVLTESEIQGVSNNDSNSSTPQDSQMRVLRTAYQNMQKKKEESSGLTLEKIV